MNTERVRWQGWDAVRCSTADAELIVGVSAGPRLLSLRRGDGPNLLHLDTTDLRVGEWRLYASHRFTVAPEGPRSYTPDNAPCDTRRSDPGLQVTAPTDVTGLRRTLGIAPASEGVDSISATSWRTGAEDRGPARSGRSPACRVRAR